MSKIFTKMIINLPQANVPLDGAKSYLSQGDKHQIIFLEFEKDVYLPEHSHKAQWEYVLNGKVDLWVNGIKHIYKKGDNFFIPKGINIQERYMLDIHQLHSSIKRIDIRKNNRYYNRIISLVSNYLKSKYYLLMY